MMPLFFGLFYLSKYHTTQFTLQREADYIYKAIEINPYNELAFFKAARYEAYANRNYPLAIEHLERFLKLYPYHLGGLIQKATLEYQLKRYDAALKSIDTVLLIDKKNKKMRDLREKILEKYHKVSPH